MAIPWAWGAPNVNAADPPPATRAVLSLQPSDRPGLARMPAPDVSVAPASARLEAVPQPVATRIAGDGLRPPPEPGSGAPAEPSLDRGLTPPPAPGGSRELRLQMREYGERYGEYSRERQESMHLAPANARWLSDQERNQFREALRERYRQHR